MVVDHGRAHGEGEKFMRKVKTNVVGPLGVLGALLLCLPCLLPVIAVLGGVAVFAALVSFITDNALLFGLGSGGVAASLAMAAHVVRTRRRNGAGCEWPDPQAMPATKTRRQQP
jgi:hypothetical protein